MTPKELQQMLNIDANRIKYFKRCGLFIPENPTRANSPTIYTQNDYERLIYLVNMTRAGLTCKDIRIIESGEKSFEEIINARIEKIKDEITTKEALIISLDSMLRKSDNSLV